MERGGEGEERGGEGEGEERGEREKKNKRGRVAGGRAGRWLTERDLLVLRFVGEHGAVSYSDVGALLTHWRSEEGMTAAQIEQHRTTRKLGPTQATVRSVVRRWEELGLAKGQKVLDGVEPVVWLTVRGYNAVDLPPKKGTIEPPLATLRHDLAVASMGRDVIVNRGRKWSGWRALGAASSSEGGVPDGVVTDGETTTAVEVELTVKERSRLQTIMVSRTAHYDRVVYLCGDEEVLRAVEKMAEALNSSKVRAMLYRVEPAAMRP